MKRMRKHNAGFTLVELIVAMAMATIVTAAATSVLLMGLRINRQTADTASQQITVRSLLNVVEDAATDGSIQSILTEYASWQLVDTPVSETTGGYRVIFGFDSDDNSIYTGREYGENGTVINEGVTILEGVYASNVTIENNLLSISIETKDGLFVSSVYCRTTNIKDDSDSNTMLEGGTGMTAREAFISKLKSQYRSRGEIKNGDGKFTYYSEWYIGGYGNDPRWDVNTPWCACFVSWALDQVGMPEPDYCNNDEHQGHPNWYANVDEFMRYFTNTPDGETDTWRPGGKEPTPGDLIFFDWDKGNNPEHVGVVLEVKNSGGATIIYTIEGNSSGRVAIRSYSINDPRIIGYGVLWPSVQTDNPQ